VATIRDVARDAGVGVGTVSRVLNGGALVSPSTRHKVEVAMQRLDFRPNATARALSQGRRQTVEAIVPLFTREFYIEVLRGVTDLLGPSDFSLVVRTVERAIDRDRAVADIVSPPRADATLIVSLVPPDQLIDGAGSATRPLIVIDGADPRLPSIAVDHDTAMRDAVGYLVGRGHRRVALIDRPDDPWAASLPTERQQGFERALAAFELSADSSLEQTTAYRAEASIEAVDQMLALASPPSALIFGSDLQAIGAMESIRRRGLRIPDDVAIIGYNDIEVAHYLGLTTVRIPMREMGRAGAELALEAIQGKLPDPGIRRLPAELIVRESAG
jgi:LacI family transcriptional regulator